MATNCLQVSQKELYEKLVCLKTRPKRPSRPLNSNLDQHVAHIGVAGIANPFDVMYVTDLFESLPPVIFRKARFATFACMTGPYKVVQNRTQSRLRQGVWAQVEPPRRELALDTVAEMGIKGGDFRFPFTG